MKAEKVELEYGFIGCSRGDTTINALILGRDDELYMLPVSYHTANQLEAWDDGDRTSWDLSSISIAAGISYEDHWLLYNGSVPEEDEE